MSRTLRFAGISGSLRKGSLNTALLTAAQSLLPPDVTLDVLDIGELPLYNSDLESNGPLPAVEAFRSRLAQADAVVISSPEYNYSVPGVLKNALDWASRGKDSPLQRKPVALMGASPGPMGTVRMQMHLRQIFLFNDMRPVNKPEVFVNNAKSKFNEQNVLTDERTIETVRTLMASLSELTRQWDSKD